MLTELQGKAKQYTGGGSRHRLAKQNLETLPKHISSVRKFRYGTMVPPPHGTISNLRHLDNMRLKQNHY